MKKIFTLTLVALISSFASFALAPISGVMGCCVGANSYLTDSGSTGGTWTSSNPAVATVIPSTGAVTGISAGITTISYTAGGITVTTSFTVSAAPAPISGVTALCIGTFSTFTESTTGGTWTSSAPGIAYFDLFAVDTSATLHGAASGSDTIYYSTGTGCSVSAMITVGSGAISPITGPNNVCVGSTITLTDSSAGGTWSCAPTSIATIDPSTGVLTGIANGTVSIDYFAAASCGSGVVTYTVTVTTTTLSGTITGPTVVNTGGTITLYEDIPGGTWSSSDPGIATIGDTTGIVSGITPGTVTITYSVTGCTGPASATYVVTVTPFTGISGTIYFPSTPDTGMVKVWLINYNSSTLDLEAIDSVMVYSSGSSAPYQFSGMSTDSFRVKAAAICSLCTMATGYVPTYHTSSFYWHDANVIYHTAGTADINQDINMMSGTTTSGPGFIGGNVTTGANKTTSGAIPSIGLKMNIVNSATTQLMGMTRTDAAGNYSFSNLPVGQTYYVFPDSLNYLTTAFTGITLTSSAPSMSTASFTQHTLSKTITPGSTLGLTNIGSIESVIAFPNPSNGRLNIQWTLKATEKGSVTISDITGREVYSSSLSMTRGTATRQIDISSLTDGLYLISIKSASISYNSKIQVQH